MDSIIEKYKEKLENIVYPWDGAEDGYSEALVNALLPLLQEVAETEREKAKDLIMNMSAEIIGTVWGINARETAWTNKDRTFFNNTAVDSRNKALEALSQPTKEGDNG